MKYKYLLIDATNLLWRSLYSNVKEILINKELIYTGGIEQFIKRLNQLLFEFSYTDSSIVYLLFDNPKSELNFRQMIDEEYKHARLAKKPEKQIYNTMNLLMEILKNYSNNYRIANLDKLEADDLTKPILESLKTEIDDFNKVLVISADMDWSRNIDKNIHWYNFVDIIDEVKFTEKYGFSPVGNKVKMYKALHGDTSDSIPNAVPYLDKNIMLHIIEKFDDPTILFKNLWKQEYSKHWKTKLFEAERQILTNFQLADFVDIECSIQEIVRKCTRNCKALRFYYKNLKIPFEGFMTTKEENKKSFLGMKKGYR